MYSDPKAVCPKEIHISLQKHIIEQIRQVGGGCPGNPELAGGLLIGRSIGKMTLKESILKKVVVDLLVTDFHQ